MKLVNVAVGLFVTFLLVLGLLVLAGRAFHDGGLVGSADWGSLPALQRVVRSADRGSFPALQRGHEKGP
jgi:hypothetical protein